MLRPNLSDLPALGPLPGARKESTPGHAVTLAASSFVTPDVRHPAAHHVEEDHERNDEGVRTHPRARRILRQRIPRATRVGPLHRTQPPGATMSLPATSPHSTGAAPEGGRARRLAGATVIVASLLQLLVLLFTFLMGLGWGGVTWLLALAQAAGALALISWVGTRRRFPLALLVPLLSAALTAALAAAGQAHMAATACSPEELAAAEQLSPPPGTDVALQGTTTQECVATIETALSSAEIIEHYRGQFQRHGWQESPELQAGPVGIAATNSRIAYDVSIEGQHDEGVPPIQVIAGTRTGSSGPCVVEPKEVEPGQHAVVLLAETGPGTVTFRGSGGEVLLEGEAGSPEQDPPTIAVSEGQYLIECRSATGPPVTTRLRVAWSDAGEVEQTQSVSIRVFESPA